MSRSNVPRSPTLEVPRKSTELVDPGARDLDESSDDGQVFSDARDTAISPTREHHAPPTRDTTILSPLTIPTTRVEKVDNSPSHGEVPGTPAYEKRMRDAVPDEIEIIPEGQRSRASSRAMRSPSSTSPGHSPVPMTRVEKVDPASPSYGEVPGTLAWEKRKADAQPDAVELASPDRNSPNSLSQSSAMPIIPKTILTRVDSEPGRGVLPGTDAYHFHQQDAMPDIIEKERQPQTAGRSSYFKRVMPEGPARSPIAEDGGFGPMDYESSKGSGEDVVEDEGFDDFAEGVTGDVDDFGDFDDFEEGFQEASVSDEQEVPQTLPATVKPPSFPVLNFSSPLSLEALIEATKPHTTALFPLAHTSDETTALPLPDSTSVFQSDRSLSLWRELIAPPPLQPPNWTRSRIRRLFLVSLGVPVDLDEILPKSKQKKLVLQYSPEAQKGGRRSSTGTKAGDPALNTGETTPPPSAGGKVSRKRRKGAPPPDFDVAEMHERCHKTAAELESMSDAQLHEHVARLDVLLSIGQDLLQYWIRRKEAAVGEKEAFDGVIENLVRHAHRLRK